MLCAALTTLLLTACGGTTTRTVVVAASPQQQPAAKAANVAKVPATTKAQVGLPCPPPPGEGVLGACTPKPVQVYGTTVIPVDPPLPASIPDVSSYQGVVNWTAVKAWQVAHHFTPGGIFKMGEYVLDPYAYRNNFELRRLGMWRAGYWFLRNTGCANESAQIAGEARVLGLRVVILDDESAEARGYDGCLTVALHHDGLIVVEYASPGSYPGGSQTKNPAWMASYGPSNPPVSPWGGPIKAFQCTDGVFGCVTYIPTLGRVDTSVDYGITKLGVNVPKPKPRLICFGSKAHRSNPTCKKVRAEVAKWEGASLSTHTALGNAKQRENAYTHLSSTLTRRARYFDGHISSTVKQYS